jgi:hypothetical protein
MLIAENWVSIDGNLRNPNFGCDTEEERFETRFLKILVGLS